MRIEIIDLHSVAVDLLTPGGWTLDAGARGFEFSRVMSLKGQKVLALDPGPDIEDPRILDVRFEKKGLVAITSTRIGTLKRCSDHQAAWVEPDYAKAPTGIESDVAIIDLTTIEALMDKYRIKVFDCVKLNIEGSEYDILSGAVGPFATQIVVSFHEHTGRGRGRAACDSILDRLVRWYHVYQRVWENRYSAGMNYWDLLLVRREME